MPDSSTKPIALITGASGFVGRYLARHLLEVSDWTLALVSRNEAGAVRLADEYARYPDRVAALAADISDAKAVQEALARTCPSYVFHLAAQTSVKDALDDPAATLGNNLFSTLNLLEGTRALAEPPRLLAIGSSEEYGHVRPEDNPVDEHTELRPDNPYGVSKVATDMLALQYVFSYKLPVIRVRAFNHIGPGQSDRFVTASFARQVALIEAGKQEPVIKVGNLSSQRDFTDVRDIVRAYYLAITQSQPGEVYNLCSEQSTSIQAVLDTLLNFCTVRVRVELDQTRLRPSDVPLIVGNAAKFRQLTGWKPAIGLRQSLADILDYWRAQVRSEP
ncbi:MAG: GDP-mannose 4,6 dehydratase [Candidatus Chloroheliales bacterium]|nr:MAG: GDP-mannose 4,6 dehydratase [Chloroflexota bacterium]